MFKILAMAFVSVCCTTGILAGTSYSEISIISVPNNKKDKPNVFKGAQVYRNEGDSLYVQRDDGTEYFYNKIVETTDKLRFTCGNKYLVFLDHVKDQLIVSHIDELESKIVFLKKK